MKNCFIRGSVIKYVQLPSAEALMAWLLSRATLMQFTGPRCSFIEAIITW